MLTRANPGGFIQNDPLTPAQANTIDINSSRGLDGTNGGTYSLAAALILNGAGGVQIGADGGVGLTSARATGPLTLVGSAARIAYRMDATVLGDADADLTIAQDYWVNPVLCTASRTFTLRHTLAGVIPAAGNRIRGAFKYTGAGAIVIAREGAVTLCSSNGSSPNYLSFEVVYDGAAWRLVAASGGAFLVNTTNAP